MTLFNDLPATTKAETIERQIECVQRELNMRRNVYPGRVAIKKMSQNKADEEIAAMEAVLGTLQSVAKAQNGG